MLFSHSIMSVSDCFTTPWTTACEASLSFTISQSLLNLMSFESVMPSNQRSTIYVELTVICGLRLGVKIQCLSLLTQLHGIIPKNPPFSSLYQVVHQAAVHVWMCFCPIGLFILVPMLHCLNYHCFFHKSYIQYFKSSYFLQFLFSRLPWLFSVLWISGYI